MTTQKKPTAKKPLPFENVLAKMPAPFARKPAPRKPAPRRAAPAKPAELLPNGLPKRLAAGKGVRGADYPGCINSGLATVLYCSKKLASARKLGLTTAKYVVGPEMLVDEFGRALIDFAATKRVWKSPNSPNSKQRLFLFATYAAAQAKYTELNDAMKATREAERAERQALADKARSGHPDDIMALVFHAMDN